MLTYLCINTLPFSLKQTLSFISHLSLMHFHLSLCLPIYICYYYLGIGTALSLKQTLFVFLSFVLLIYLSLSLSVLLIDHIFNTRLNFFLFPFCHTFSSRLFTLKSIYLFILVKFYLPSLVVLQAHNYLQLVAQYQT